MAYTPYYAPYSRPMGYYNPSIPQQDMQTTQQIPAQQPIQQMPMQTLTPFMQTQPTNDMIWVLGQTEAESYLVAPNNSVVLWDKNNPTIYVKSVNAQGVPSMRILDFTERNADTSNFNVNTPKTHVCQCGDKFVTKEMFEALQSEFEALQSKIEALTDKPKAKTTKAKVEEE